jgi:hypothetical protein
VAAEVPGRFDELKQARRGKPDDFLGPWAIRSGAFLAGDEQSPGS